MNDSHDTKYLETKNNFTPQCCLLAALVGRCGDKRNSPSRMIRYQTIDVKKKSEKETSVSERAETPDARILL
uniref:Uncharacterized protein n=1 Tax=Caenorhabditis tropicalis TaxID=1561998 RepID=A0A1I7TQC7_9PELO